MQERSAKPRGWVTGLLRAGRAAAFLTLATGINGLISAYFSGYEPIYVYLVAVVVVALTSGLLLGVSSAVAAVVVYDWMFAPVRLVPSMSMAVPLAIAVAAAVAARAARIPFQPRTLLAEPVPPPLLPVSPTVHPVSVVDDERVVELEKQLAVLRATAENESRLRGEAAAAARMREAQLERELQLLRSRAADETSRSTPATDRQHQELVAKVADAENRVAALHQELDVAWHKADEERARADREATLRQQVEEAGRTSLQQTIADLTSKHEGALGAAAKKSAETAAALSMAQEQVEQAKRAVEAERLRTAEQEAALAVARGEAEKLRNRAEKLRVHLEEERARAAREAEMRQGLQSSAKENLEQTIRQISSRYESELTSARQRAEAKDVRIAELESAVDAAVAAVQQERSRVERESGLRAQLEVAARETLQRTADVAGDHQRAAVQARREAEEAAQRAAALEQELAALRAAADQTVAEREAALRAELESGGSEALQRAVETSAALEQQLAELRADSDRRIAEREAALREELQSASSVALQQAVDDAAAKERLAAEAAERAAVAERRAAMLETHLEELRSEIDRTLAETQAHSESIESELVRVRSILETETARADRETEMREQAEIAAQQTQALFNETAARYESTLTKLRAEAENERGAAATAREQVLALQQLLSEERETLSTARAERQRLMADFDEKLQTIVNGITSDYEHAIGEATVERESARAEVRNLTIKLQKAQEARSSGPDMQRLEAAITETASRYEAALTAARQALEAASAEAAAARQQAESAQTAADIERAAHERTRLDFDQKLQAIVSGITSDQEHALGEALIEKEAARAEARTLSSKLQEVQRSLLGFDEMQSKVQRANDQLRAALTEAQNAAAQERAAREKSEAEWSEKLQKIVSHLASDHESDLGDALLAKEAARAEARNLSAKVASLQAQMEEDREKFRVAFEKWTAERASLQQQLQAAQQRERRASTPPTREQPLPAVARTQPVILFVHSDVGIRAMWKHTLEQAGYTILTAADGLEGLRIAAQQRPDVVVAETVMPKMNARELIQLLKSKRETAGTKIVLLGGGKGEAERASDYRADGIVQNPSDFRALRETLASVLAM